MSNTKIAAVNNEVQSVFNTKLNSMEVKKNKSFITEVTELSMIHFYVNITAQAEAYINSKYIELGAAAGWLGNPTGKITLTPNGEGWYQHFQNGSIYFRSPETGAHEVHGAIRDKWASLGWEGSFLGFPLTDETPTPDGRGRFNHFQGGSIYWNPKTGAHEVHGAIRDKWASLGWEKSFLGYPITDELTTLNGQGRFSDFEHGQIAWSPWIGAGVSATSFNLNQSGGLRPQGLGANGSPEVRRRVVGSAYMRLTDDETFGSNEHGEASGSGETIVTNFHPQDVMPKIIGKAGGEVRVELTLIAQALTNGDVRITGRADLYEGTSEEDTDHDGDEDIDILIPRDEFRSYSVTVRNEDEGGDFADITMNFSNFSV